MKSRVLLVFALLIMPCLTARSAKASSRRIPPPEVRPSQVNLGTAPADGERIVVTRHQITLAGRTLKYTARAGRLPIMDEETGQPHAYMFFVSYTVDRSPGEKPRPLTFAWNGGPGAASSYVHMMGFGPKRIQGLNDPVHPPASVSEMGDNQGTWLGVTDLVFIDAVGTGFSRVTKPEYEPEFYSVLGDMASFAEFIRLYRDRFHAWDQPLFLAGESYGAWRASAVAEALERNGIAVSGVILISGGIQAGNVGTDEMKTALYLPRFTAGAYFFKKLPPDLQSGNLQDAMEKAATWARTEYEPALMKRNQLTEPERQAVIMQLSHFTGLNPALIDRENFNLTLSSSQFCSELLQAEKLTCHLLDMRVTNQTTPRGQWDVMSRYLREALGYQTALSYINAGRGYEPSIAPLSEPIGRMWKWDQAKTPTGRPNEHVINGLNINQVSAQRGEAFVVGSGNGPPGPEPTWLIHAMTMNPELKVFVAAGMFDSLNSCLYNSYEIHHLAPQFSRRMAAVCYHSGHVIYLDKSARLRLKHDVTGFIREAVASVALGNGTDDPGR